MGLFNKFFGGTGISGFTKKLEKFASSQVGSEMTKDVMTIAPDEPLINAANIMIGEHISCLVVVGVKGEQPLGIITERDFLTQPPGELEDLSKMKVHEIMTADPVTVQPSLSLMDASDIMNEHKFRKVIVTEDNELAGILTQTDLVRKMDDFYEKVPFKTSDSLTVKSVKKKVVTVDVNDTISDAHHMMMDHNLGSILVVEGGDLKGMFTEFDFLSRLALDQEDMVDIKMGEAMSFPLVGVDEEVDLFDANHLMLEKNFRRLPVFENGELSGKTTQTNIRENGYALLKKTLERARKGELEKVNFQTIKKRNLVREIKGKTQEFTYPKRP